MLKKVMKLDFSILVQTFVKILIKDKKLTPFDENRPFLKGVIKPVVAIFEATVMSLILGCESILTSMHLHFYGILIHM